MYYCYKCTQNVTDHGGSQLRGCNHYLCTECIEKIVADLRRPGIRCEGVRGVYRCEGRLSHEELEDLVSESIYADYATRVSNWSEGPEEEFAELNLTPEERKTGWAHMASWIDEYVRQGKTRLQAQEHINSSSVPVVETRARITCSKCRKTNIPAGHGIVLKNCNHLFCKPCIKAIVKQSNAFETECPDVDEDGNTCEEAMDRFECKEIRKFT